MIRGIIALEFVGNDWNFFLKVFQFRVIPTTLSLLCTYFPSFSELLKLLYKILNRIGSSKLVRIFNVF